MKTAIILPTALIRTIGQPDSDLCLRQLISGLNKISRFINKYPDTFELFWVDNTIKPNVQYDHKLVSTVENLPNLAGKKTFFENYYNPDGSVNKGCGVIAIWREILPEIINKYELIIHIEPRQEIRNLSFFDAFIKKPDSYFKTMYRQPDHRTWRKYLSFRKREVWTGLFSCPPQILIDYAREKTFFNLNGLAEKRFHIEGDLYNYLRKNRIPFKPLSDLGLRWHDNERNKKYII